MTTAIAAPPVASRRELVLAIVGAIAIAGLLLALVVASSVDTSLGRLESSLTGTAERTSQLGDAIRGMNGALQTSGEQLARVGRNMQATAESTKSVADNVDATNARVRRTAGALDVNLPARRR